MACAWFPDEKVMTPRRLWSAESLERALYAPRNLKAPARWRFSHLKKTSAPVRAFTVRDVATGVRCAALAIWRAALSTSANIGSVIMKSIGRLGNDGRLCEH